MKYNIIKVFVIGSTKLDKYRKEISDIAHRITTLSINSDEIVKTILCIYSFENVNSHSQNEYDYIISNKADAVITLIDNDLADKSYEEAILAKETNIRSNGIRPLLYGMINKNVKNNILVNKDYKSIDELANEILVNKTYFQSYTYKNFREQVSILLNNIVSDYNRKGLYKKADNIYWINDSFAYLTIETRFKENYKIVAENFDSEEFDSYSVFEKSNIFKKECKIRENTIIEEELTRFLEDNKDALGTSSSMTLRSYFRSVPFLLAEYYFYYHLLYLYHEKKKLYDIIEDPYRCYKLKHLNDGKGNNSFDALLSKFKSIFSNPAVSPHGFLLGCLNMNSIDLSQLEVNVREFKNSNMPIDDSSIFHRFITKELSEIRDNGDNQELVAHLITDNSGFELMSDILLASYLLHTTKLTKIAFHVKRLPIFVSDTIMSDVVDAFKVLNSKLKDSTQFSMIKESVNEQVYICEAIPNKHICFIVEDQWHRETLFQNLSIFNSWNTDNSCSLIIVKGDLNYRRMVGDKHWNPTDSIIDRVSYIHKPILIIRSLKSNVVLGVSNEKQYSDNAPNWKVSGDYGIIHFLPSLEKR